MIKISSRLSAVYPKQPHRSIVFEFHPINGYLPFMANFNNASARFGRLRWSCTIVSNWSMSMTSQRPSEERIIKSPAFTGMCSTEDWERRSLMIDKFPRHDKRAGSQLTFLCLNSVNRRYHLKQITVAGHHGEDPSYIETDDRVDFLDKWHNHCRQYWEMSKFSRSDLMLVNIRFHSLRPNTDFSSSQRDLKQSFTSYRTCFNLP